MIAAGIIIFLISIMLHYYLFKENIYSSLFNSICSVLLGLACLSFGVLPLFSCFLLLATALAFGFCGFKEMTRPR